MSIAGLSASIVRRADGQLNIMHLIRDAGSPARSAAAPVTGAKDKDPLAGWNIGLRAFDVSKLQVDLEDRSLDQPGHFKLSDVSANLQDISNKPGATFPLNATVDLAAGGRIQMSGDVSALPSPAANLKITATDLACRAAQPWVGNVMRVNIRDGKIGLNANVNLASAGGLSVSGDFKLADLKIVDTTHDRRLLGWQSVTIDRYEYQGSANKAQVSTVEINRPYVSFTINKDLTTNVQALMVKRDSQSAAPQNDRKSTPLDITVGRVNIDSGSADYSDRSLPFPFHAEIAKLGGEITTLSTSTSNPSRVHLQGQVGNWGLAKIDGSINPLGPTLKTDMGVVFRNIDFPDLSPYTIKFAGRKIARGRLDLNLRYKLDKGQLEGANNIVIHDFELGDKVDEPGAMDLPLGLAIALLEDPDGKIDLDLPVTGDVNDPQFKISGIVMQAFANVIKGIVTSPFRLLGKLIGGSGNDFGEIEFEPGLATLSPPEQEKLANLAKALALRPILDLKVPGAVAPDEDSAAIRKLRVDARVDALVKAANASSTPNMYAEVERKAIESLFVKAFPEEPLSALQQQYTAVPKDQPDAKPTFDEQTYVASMRQQLIEAEPVTAADLEGLANGRADAIIAALTADKKIDPARIARSAGKPARPTKAGWVPVSLEVEASGAPPQHAKPSGSGPATP